MEFRSRHVCKFPADEPKAGISVTKPGQALTVEELFRRHLQGLAPPIGRKAVESPYEEDFNSVDLEEVERMDLSERGEVLDSLREKNAYWNRVKKEADEKAALLAKEADKGGKDEPEEDVPTSKPKKAAKRPSASSTS